MPLVLIFSRESTSFDARQLAHALPTYFRRGAAANETGAGEGAGKSVNILLEMGADEDAVLKALDRGIAAVRDFEAKAAVILLGFDMAADDPLAAVAVHAAGFAQMAQWLAAMGLPTVLVQEGGYVDALAEGVADDFVFRIDSRKVRCGYLVRA